MATDFQQKLKQVPYRSYSQSLNIPKQPPQKYLHSHSFNDHLTSTNKTEPEISEISEINFNSTPLCSDADSDSDFDDNLIQTTTKWYMAFPDDDTTPSPSPNIHKFIPITRSEPHNYNNNITHQQETDLFAAKTKIYLPTNEQNKNKNQLYSEGDGGGYDTDDECDGFPITMMGYTCNNNDTSEGNMDFNDNIQHKCVTLMGHIQTNENENNNSDINDICIKNNKANITLMGNGDLSLKIQFKFQNKEVEGNNDFGENENGVTLMGYCNDNNVPFISKK